MTQSLNADVYDVTGKVTGSFELPAELFDVEVNVPLIHQVVNAQLAAARQGTHSTKTRGEVSGGGKKPFKQKGTGRAPGVDSRSAVHGRRHRPRPQASRLLAAHPQEDDRRCVVPVPFGPRAQRTHSCG